ncbi:MAG: type II CAAX endopeptidase family protein [Gemmatimonadota bacterium]
MNRPVTNGEVVAEAALVLAVILGGSALSAWTGSIGFGVTAVVLALLLATYLLRRSGESWRDMGLRRPSGWGKAILAAVLTYIAMAATVGVAVPLALSAFGLDGPTLSQFAGLEGNLPLLLFFLGPIAWGTAAFGEEMVVRGFLLDRLSIVFAREHRAWGVAVAVQAILFGLAHAYQGVSGVVTTATLGLVLGIAYLKVGRNLWPVIIAHGVADTVSLIAIYLGALPTS